MNRNKVPQTYDRIPLYKESRPKWDELVRRLEKHKGMRLSQAETIQWLLEIGFEKLDFIEGKTLR